MYTICYTLDQDVKHNEKVYELADYSAIDTPWTLIKDENVLFIIRRFRM